MRMPSIGDDFGDFVVDEVLGRGGMGIVYAATQRRLSRSVALKVMSPQLSEDESYRRRFVREAEVLSRLSSPHIVHIYDYGSHEGCLYLATQLVRGGDLGARLREGPLSVSRAIRVTVQVCQALADAHEAGVLHRDVKPSNILLRDDTLRHAYLADFGTARSTESELTRAGDQVGTLAYMAPEVCLREGASEASDVYSAGCVLWKALTGSAPYGGVDLQVASGHINGPVPQLDQGTPGLDRVLARALAKDPAQRFASAAAMADALEELEHASASGAHVDTTQVRQVVADETRLRSRGLTVADAEPHTPTPPLAASPYVPESPRPRTRRTWPAVAAVAALLLVVIGAGGWWLSARDDQSSSSDKKAPRASTLGSVDADPSADIVIAPYGPSQPVMVATSEESGFAEPAPWTSALPASDSSDRPHRLLGDVDGDGQADLVEVQRPFADERQTVVVRRSTGRSFDVEETWGSVDPIVDRDDENFVIGDFDNDGHDDLGRVTFTVGHGVRVEVMRSTGRRFTSARDWIVEIPARYDYSRFVVGDFDGDGRVDLVLALPLNGGLQLSLLRSTGVRFDDARPWGQIPGADPVTSRLFAGDFDGDGLSDLADQALSPARGTQVFVLRSTSTSFATPTIWYRDADDRPSDSWTRAGRYDADRQADLSLVVDDGDGGVDIRLLRARTGRFEDAGVVAALPDYAFLYERPLGPIG